MDSEFMYRNPIVSIFAADDPHAGQASFSLNNLPGLPYIALNEGVDDEITAVLEANGIQPDTRFIESDDHAVVAMVEQGLGTSLMSMMMIQGFSRQIAAVPLDRGVLIILMTQIEHESFNLRHFLFQRGKRASFCFFRPISNWPSTVMKCTAVQSTFDLSTWKSSGVI